MERILCLCAALAAAQAVADEPTSDHKALQGTWVPVKAELAGKPLPDDAVKAIALKINEEGYEVTIKGEGSDKGTCTLDTAVTPKGMKITSVKGANAGKTFLAIYELEHDRLRVCYDLSGAKRPTEFKTSPGTLLYLVTYHRQKT
jgi:uncharacterized protein (TIGR03067 family)